MGLPNFFAMYPEFRFRPAEWQDFLRDRDDRFLRTAARLVMQRIEPKKWADLVGDPSDRIAHEAIIALCKIGKANDYADPIIERLHDNTPGETAEQLLDWARTVQLALVQIGRAHF